MINCDSFVPVQYIRFFDFQHFMIYWLTTGLDNVDGLHVVTPFNDLFAKVWCGNDRIFAVLLWLGKDNINCCPQVSASNTFEKMADFSLIINTSVMMTYRAIHCCVLFLVEDTCLTQFKLSSHYHSDSAAFFLLLWPAQPHGWSKEITYELQSTLLCHPSYSSSALYIHLHLCW